MIDREQAIRVARNKAWIASDGWTEREGRLWDEAWAKAVKFLDAVLAVPPAEPQEGERVAVCPDCGKRICPFSMLNPGRPPRLWCSACWKMVPTPEMKSVQSSPDPVREAAEALVAAEDAYHEAGGEGGTIRGVHVAIEALRAALRSVREPGPNVTEEGKLQAAIDHAYDAAMEFGDNPQQALVCVVEWLESVVSEGPGEGTAR